MNELKTGVEITKLYSSWKIGVGSLFFVLKYIENDVIMEPSLRKYKKSILVKNFQNRLRNSLNFVGFSQLVNLFLQILLIFISGKFY